MLWKNKFPIRQNSAGALSAAWSTGKGGVRMTSKYQEITITHIHGGADYSSLEEEKITCPKNIRIPQSEKIEWLKWYNKVNGG
jgi:hypothetical protein